jgi:hypothetical protein
MNYVILRAPRDKSFGDVRGATVNPQRIYVHSWLLFFLFDSMARPLFLPRLINFLGHRFAGEMSRPSSADDHELFGGVEGLLDAEIFHFARNLRLSLIINQALSPGAEIAEPDFDPAINRIFSQF